MKTKENVSSNNAGYARPKEAIVYHFGSTGECWVSAYPQQTWEFCKHGSNVEISSDKHHITLQIPVQDFERQWVIKKKKEGGKHDKKRADSSD